jgi:hypothetical protein
MRSRTLSLVAGVLVAALGTGRQTSTACGQPAEGVREVAAVPVIPQETPLQVSDAGYLYQPAFCLDYELRGPVCAYVPQPGDIYLATEAWPLARVGHKVVHSGAPHHSGIVFALPDGPMALLEGGPENTLHIRILDLIPQITRYFATRRVWIPQRQVPLTPEQSRRLTAFALAVADRPFAVARMVMEAGPFRARGDPDPARRPAPRHLL